MTFASIERRRRFESEAIGFMPALYRNALHLTRSANDARDLVQETYLRAYRVFDQYTPGTNCRAWLFTIMHSIFNTAYQKSRREQEGMQVMAVEAQLARDATSAASDVPMADGEVGRALGELAQEFRAVVLLVDVAEFSYEEAAQVLRCPVGTVRSRLFRARKLLAAALASHAHDLGYAVSGGQA